MTIWPRYFLHGSKHKHIERLSALKGSDEWPFGPALYLTEDPVVARSYAKDSGAIYQLKLEGNPNFTIALDQRWKDQSVEARMVVRKLLSSVNALETSRDTDNARSIIDLANLTMGKLERNKFLRDSGIWLLYGHVDAVESGGMNDRGIQYALIDDGAIVSQSRYADSRDVVKRGRIN